MKLFEILEREDNCLSLPRICAVVGFLIICCGLVAECFGIDIKHLPEFMAFDTGLFAWCGGSRYLDIKQQTIKAGVK